MSDRLLRHINTLLLLVILAINGYIATAPFAPQAWYWWQTHHSDRQAKLQAAIGRTGTTSPVVQQSDPSAPKTNRLIIPKMLLDTPITEGPQTNSFQLLGGAWRLPFGSEPSKGGNTVIASHRFSFTGGHGVFYYLDKLAVGDEIGLQWNGHMYHYQVVSSRVIQPTEVSIQAPTDDSRLTLYTCTPLWNPKQRLVIVATLETTEKELP